MFRNLIKISSLLFAVSLLGYSCGDDDDNDSNDTKEDGGIDTGEKNKIDDLACTNACKAVSKCAGEYNFDDCYGLYCNQDGLLIVPSKKCLTAIEKASCDEHDTLGVGSYYDICFPSCSEESTSCTEDDAMETCVETNSGDYVSMTITCESICQSAEESGAYTGICGTKTTTGQTSHTGNDVCFCRSSSTGSTSSGNKCAGNCNCTCGGGAVLVTGLLGGACTCNEACRRSGYGFSDSDRGSCS